MGAIGVGLGIGYNGARGIERAEAVAYIDRVEADGGTVFLNSRQISIRLNSITCRTFPQFIIDYFDRVDTDGGELFLTRTEIRLKIQQITC
jgi:hypothetical protein